MFNIQQYSLLQCTIDNIFSLYNADIEYLKKNYNSYVLQEVHKLETDLGHLPQKWKVLWDKLEFPNREAVHRQVSFNTQLNRSHGRSLHKRSTLEILVKGKMLGEAAKMFSQPHHFEKHTYTTPAYCDYCTHVLWGLVKTGTLSEIVFCIMEPEILYCLLVLEWGGAF